MFALSKVGRVGVSVVIKTCSYQYCPEFNCRERISFPSSGASVCKAWRPSLAGEDPWENMSLCRAENAVSRDGCEARSAGFPVVDMDGVLPIVDSRLT